MEKDLVDLKIKKQGKTIMTKVPSDFRDAWYFIFGEVNSRKEILEVINNTFKSRRSSSEEKIRFWNIVFLKLFGRDECRKFIDYLLREFSCRIMISNKKIENVRRQIRYLRIKNSQPQVKRETICYK